MDEPISNGPTFTQDELITHLSARAAEEHARKADGSESAAKTADFIEETGVNSQALSWGGSILKKLPKKDGQSKAMDIIRSLEVMLPMLKSHIGDNGTLDMDLDGSGDDEAPDQEESSVRPIKFGAA